MPNETDGFNEILNGLQIALDLLSSTFSSPSKAVFHSARDSIRAANSKKNTKVLNLEKGLLAF